MANKKNMTPAAYLEVFNEDECTILFLAIQELICNIKKVLCVDNFIIMKKVDQYDCQLFRESIAGKNSYDGLSLKTPIHSSPSLRLKKVF